MNQRIVCREKERREGGERERERERERKEGGRKEGDSNNHT